MAKTWPPKTTSTYLASHFHTIICETYLEHRRSAVVSSLTDAETDGI